MMPAQLGQLAEIVQQPLEAYYADLLQEGQFLEEIAAATRGVSEFAQARLANLDDFHFYRTLLYLMVRLQRPNHVVETGVLNGFGTAFLLLGLHHNGFGQLHSIDIPPEDPRILAQGTRLLPLGKSPGWTVPQRLRNRWDLHLADCRVALPRLLDQLGGCDLFIHDSDHSYTHMMFEMGLAHSYLPTGAWMIVDNIEENNSFSDFCRATGEHHGSLISRTSAQGTWTHGLLRKG